MGVPAHDKRDFEFAKKFGLEIIPVIKGYSEKEAFDSKDSACINSNSSELTLNDLSFKQAFNEVVKWAENKKNRKKENSI